MGTVIGLDIGTTGVRAVETVTGARSVTVRRAHAVPLPPSTFVDGMLRDRATLVAALKQLRRQGRFSSSKAAVVVGSHPAVLVRAAKTPWLASRSDMTAVVNGEAEMVLPRGTDDMYVGHHVADVYDIENDDGTVSTQANVAVVGVQKTYLEAILDCVWAAGFTPTSVDITTFALSRFISQASSGAGVIDVVLHLGATTVTMAAVVDKQFVAEYPLNNFAGAQLTDELSMNLDMPLEKAEALKVSDRSVRDPGSPYTEQERDEADSTIAAWSTSMVREVKSKIAELTHAFGKPVGRIWLSGGEARLPNLATRLSAELGGSSKVAVLDATAWVEKPERLQAAAEKTDQDLTSAVAASVR